MTREEIRRQVAILLPGHDPNLVNIQVDGALGRLAKVYIRHWRSIDQFCLTWNERLRLAGRLAQMAVLDNSLRVELARAIEVTSIEMGVPQPLDIDASILYARQIIEKVLLDRGEIFASAVASERPQAFVRYQDIEAVVYHQIATKPPPVDLDARVLVAVVEGALLNSTDEVRTYLRSLADTYTLFAFMRETPDVQSAVSKIFSDGDLWLDTSVVLPLLAESLLDEGSRSHTNLLNAAAESGLRLFATEGVLEEVVTHILRCRSYHRALGNGNATGEPPFLLNMYAASGRNLQSFSGWLETFAGSRSPDDDVADYLEGHHRIVLKDLQTEASTADPNLCAAIAEVWHSAREVRERNRTKRGHPPMDNVTIQKLVSHDVVNYLGVTMRRAARNERRGAFGFRSWWLTFDGTAFRMEEELKKSYEGKIPPSPAISPDFMVHYLAIGPIRARLSKRTEEALPLMMNMSLLDAVPRDLLGLAESLRQELSGLPPHVIDRKIRDTMDEARVLLGPAALGGEGGLTAEMRARLIAQAKTR